MRKFALAIAAAALLPIACTSEKPAADTGTDTETVATEDAGNVVADLGGEPTGPVYTKAAGDTLALSGYDAVSYFQGDGKPVEGSKDFTVKYQGFDYRFANEENAKTFAAEPAKYVPAYGGYCAWAIGANNALAPGDPNVYDVVDGKLYLNFSPAVKEKWTPKKDEFIKSGDENYPTHDASERFDS